MGDILVAGIVNLETTVRIDGFPLDYEPARYPFFGINSAVSGVGFNVAKALTALGNRVRLVSLRGADPPSRLAAEALEGAGIEPTYVLELLAQQPQSVVLYDPQGRRQIHVDIKNAQEIVYPAERFDSAIVGCSLAVLGNANFTRPLLARARSAGVPIATDIHAIADLDDPYNRDYMDAADILFMSHERLPCQPERWVELLLERCRAAVAVVGMGAAGALLGVRREGVLRRVPAAQAPSLVSTVGAGDALFAAFLDAYLRTADPHRAIERAVVFAAHKLAVAGAAQGFLTAPELDALVPASR